METNKPALTGIRRAVITAATLAAILVAILAALSGSEAMKLRKLRRSIEELRGLAKDTVPVTKDEIEALKQELLRLQGPGPELSLLQGPAGEGASMAEFAGESAPAEEPADISQTAALVRGLLIAHRIQPERFKINGSAREAEDKPAEFVIRAAPLLFFSFLADASKQAGVVISSLSIRSNIAAKPAALSVNMQAMADITMRVRNRAPSYRDLPQSRRQPFSQDAAFPAPEALALAFSPRAAAPRSGQDGRTTAEPGSEEAADGSEALTDVPLEAIPAEPERRQFKPLGTIRDAGGREYLYGKDAESGGLVKIYTGEELPEPPPSPKGEGSFFPDLDNQ
jgi:hypothetical protein